MSLTEQFAQQERDKRELNARRANDAMLQKAAYKQQLAAAEQAIPRGISQFKDDNGMEYIVGKDGVPIPFDQMMEGLAGMLGGSQQMPNTAIGISDGQWAAKLAQQDVDASKARGYDESELSYKDAMEASRGDSQDDSYVYYDEYIANAADMANAAAAQRMQKEAAVGKANAVNALTQYGYTPEQAMQLVGQTDGLAGMLSNGNR